MQEQPRNIIFTLLHAEAFITLVAKIDAATIQIRPLLIAHNRSLHHYCCNRLWAYSHAVNLRGATFNQVNNWFCVIHLPTV